MRPKDLRSSSKNALRSSRANNAGRRLPATSPSLAAVSPDDTLNIKILRQEREGDWVTLIEHEAYHRGIDVALAGGRGEARQYGQGQKDKQDFLDRQDRVSYAFTHKKGILIIHTSPLKEGMVLGTSLLIITGSYRRMGNCEMFAKDIALRTHADHIVILRLTVRILR